MKILALVGSYRKNGNTEQFIDLIIEHLQQIARHANRPIEVEKVSLGRLELGSCRGCRACFDRGEEKCPVRDQLMAVKASMQAADGILVASPVYVDDVSGQVKTWIDRLAHVCHRPEFAGKVAYTVVTVGSSPAGHALGTLATALSTWGFHIAGQDGIKTGALMKPEAVRASFDEKAARIAGRFYRAIERQDYARPSFRSLMTFKIQQHFWQRADSATFDYQYWLSKGWLDPQQTYYIPHRASPLKVILARAAGTLLAPLVS